MPPWLDRLRITTRPDRSSSSLQDRFERSRWGKIVISAFVVYIVGAIAVFNLPPSKARSDGLELIRPVIQGSGLHQDWALFAPDPRRTTWELEARLSYDDGTTLVWHRPTGDRVVSTYRSYRWRKYMSRLFDDDESFLRPWLAAWLAEEYEREGASLTQLTLIRRFWRIPPPGSGEARPAFDDEVIYTVRVPPSSNEQGGS